jgi:hypothetical protein
MSNKSVEAYPLSWPANYFHIMAKMILNLKEVFCRFVMSENTGGNPPRKLRSFSFKSRVSQKRELRGVPCVHRQNSAFLFLKLIGVLP